MSLNQDELGPWVSCIKVLNPSACSSRIFTNSVLHPFIARITLTLLSLLQAVKMKRALPYLVLFGIAVALPQGGVTGPPSDAYDDTIVDTSPTSTVTASANTATEPPSEVTENATPIPSSNSYWWIDYSCGGSTPDGEVKWKFIERAYTDATEIANVAKQWPDKFTESSDLYVGRNFQDSKWKDEFRANLAAAGAWQSDNHLPFQNWIRVTCDDLYHACGGKIGSDPRTIAAYANNTVGQFGSVYSKITVCDPFFTFNNLQEVKRFHESVDPADMQLIYMLTSGQVFLHEAMHLTQITEDRTHIVDQTFDGGRRIYGPRDVAKAARIANREGFDKNAINADTYAVFAQAAYWQDHYGTVIPPDQRGKAVPAGVAEHDVVQDSSSNYVRVVVEEDGPKELEPDCTAGSGVGISLAAAEDIQSQWAGEPADGEFDLSPGLSCAIAGLSGNGDAQVSVCGSDDGGKAKYGDMAAALQSIIDKCTDGDLVNGKVDVPNASGLTVETYM